MRSFGDCFADLVEMQLHCFGVGRWQHERCTLAMGRTDGAEQVGVLVALVGRLTGPRTLLRPQAGPAVLLPDTSFVLEPDFNRRLLRQIGYMRLQRVGEVFLNAVMIRSSCLGCCGRALMRENPMAASSLETVRSQ